MKIFISYRRDDSADVAGRIYDRLVRTYGEHSIFKDVDSIPFGLDFRTHLDDSVKVCDVFLAIIGSDWLAVSNKEGLRRIDDKNDWVRIEIESALQRNIPVIPVYVHNTPPLSAEDLPDGLVELIYRNAISVRSDPDFHNDMNRLIRGIDEVLAFLDAKQESEKITPGIEEIPKEQPVETPPVIKEAEQEIIPPQPEPAVEQEISPPQPEPAVEQQIIPPQPEPSLKPVTLLSRGPVNLWLVYVLHIFGGFGFFLLDPTFKRRWLYPAVYWVSLITFVLQAYGNADMDMLVLLILWSGSALLWVYGFFDLGIHYNRHIKTRKMPQPPQN